HDPRRGDGRQAADVPGAGHVDAEPSGGRWRRVAPVAGGARAVRARAARAGAAPRVAVRPPLPRAGAVARESLRLLTRHVLRGFLGLFLLIFAAAVAVFVIIDYAGNSQLWIGRPPGERATYYLNYLPYIAFLVCPIALLLAAVFSVGNLARHFEVV